MALIAGIYFFSYFHRVAVPGTVFDEIQADLGVSAGAVALLGAIYLYVYAGMQIVTGVLADRFGAPRIILVGGTVLSLGSILFPLSHSLTILYVTRGLIGLGASLVFVSVVKELDHLFSSRNFAMMLGVTMFVGYSGGLFGTLPFERMVAAWGWRGALLVMGAACTLTVASSGVTLKRMGWLKPPDSTASSFALFDVLRNTRVLPVLLSTPILFGVYFLLQAIFGKKLLTDCCGMSSPAAATVTFAMMLTGMCFTSAAGFLCRAMGNRRRPLIIFSLGLCLLSTAMLVVGLSWQSPSLIVACCIGLAMSSMQSPIAAASMKELSPPNSAGTSIGVLNASSYMAVALMTTVSGTVMDAYSRDAVRIGEMLVYPPAAYRTIFIICLALVVVAFGASLRIPESRGESVYGRTGIG
jgi:MFS family permease